MVKEKVLDLANHISNKKRGSKNEIKVTDPEYMILEPVVTDEMAEVALCMEIRKKVTAKEIAPLCGKTVEETTKLLLKLAEAGVCFVNKINGVDVFWYDTWVPGIMEMMVNNKENVKKYPQIARAFEAYGRVRGPKTAGNFPVGVGLMRVIPIEHAISGETRRASYEEVSKYLNENEIFQLQIVLVVQQEKLWEKAVVILKKICVFRWDMLQNIIFVQKEEDRLLVKKLLKLLKGLKRMV